MTKIELKTVGSDPEFFVKRSDGLFIPSAAITEGTKENPEATNRKGFYTHKDNLTIEGNIPPAHNKKEFIENMKFLKDILNVMAKIQDCEIVSEDIAYFKPRFLNIADAHEFGCSNYHNVWTRYYHESQKVFGDFRVAGFHIHLGYDITSNEFKNDTIDNLIGRAFDLFLTYPSDKIHLCEQRRFNYGTYGSVRKTSYGIECRTLGGYFTRDEYLPWVYDQIEKMFEWLNNETNLRLLQAMPLYPYGKFSGTEKRIKEIYKKLKLEEVNVGII
jgi:hypothetical protein